MPDNISFSMTTEAATYDFKTKKKEYSLDIDFDELNLATQTLYPYLEYRIKILTISNTTLKPRVEKIIPTNLIILEKNIPKHIQLQLKSSNKLPVKFLSEKVEIINNRLFVRILNPNNFMLKICIKSPIAYLFIQPTLNQIFQN